MIALKRNGGKNMLRSIVAICTGTKSKWITLAVWIAAAIILTLTLPAVGDKVQNNASSLPEDAASVIADEMVQNYFPSASGSPALLVWHNKAGLTDQDFTYIRSLAQHLEGSPLPAQEGVIPYHNMPMEVLQALTSEDGTTLVQPILFEGQTQTAQLKENLKQIKQYINDNANSDLFTSELQSDLSARFTGPVGITVDATDLFLGADFVLLIATVLLVLILLLVIYRSPILAIIPLIGVGFAYLITSPLLGFIADQGWITIDSQAVSIMTVLLFGAGTDYCLFLITRYRDKLLEESSPRAAISKAYFSAAGAIAMSGFTVVLALLALLFAQFGPFHRFAIPFSLSILIMGIASLTLVPALLAILGRASFYPFVPRTIEMNALRAQKLNKEIKPVKEQHRIGKKIGELVVRKPWRVIVITISILAVFAIFSTQTKFTYNILSSFPEKMESVEGFNLIGEAYTPGELAPLKLIVEGEHSAEQLIEAISKESLVHHISDGTISDIDPKYTSYEIVLAVNPYNREAMALVPQLKSIAENVLQTSNSSWLAGQTAAQYDQQQIIARDEYVVMPIVLVLITILLLIYLRSIVASAYLIATVLLSYFSALGLGWLILHYVLGFDAIQGAIPLYAFVFLIALGEDYNIFMISSIWRKAKTMPLKQAIKEGVGETGGVITSAGLILAATFAVLTQLPITVLLQFGLITAIGVLMDTFIVRPFLVPAITAVSGKWAFWPAKHQDPK